MQFPRADMLTAFQRERVVGWAEDFISGAETKAEIILKSFDTETTDFELGTVVRTSVDDVVDALRRTVRASEALASGGRLQVDDKVYLVRQERISFAVQTIDRVVDGTEELAVLAWREDPLGAWYVIEARGVGSPPS